MDKEQLDALERIADLKAKGAITEAEFGKMKQKILSDSIPTSDHQPSIAGSSGPGSTSVVASGPSQANDEEKRQADTLANAAILLGVVALLFLPIVLGPIGIILGAISNRKGSDRGLIAVVVATVGTVAGMLLGILAWT